jgi:hypothetical protein
MGSLSPIHWVAIIVIVLLLIGGGGGFGGRNGLLASFRWRGSKRDDS